MGWNVLTTQHVSIVTYLSCSWNWKVEWILDPAYLCKSAQKWSFVRKLYCFGYQLRQIIDDFHLDGMLTTFFDQLNGQDWSILVPWNGPARKVNDKTLKDQKKKEGSREEGMVL